MILLTAAAAAQTPAPPVAPVVPHVVKSPHGDRVDEYHWLRDDDPQSKRPEILRHLQAENAHTAAMMAPLQGLKEFTLQIHKPDGQPDMPALYGIQQTAATTGFCRQAALRHLLTL